VVLPDDCLRGPAGEGPGIQRTLAFDADGELVVSGVDVEDGLVVVEAETMHNVLDDAGYEAFYALGPPDQFVSNGVSMRADAGYKIPIALDREVELPGRRYEAWMLMPIVSPRLVNGLASFWLEADGRTFADVTPRARSDIAFWDKEPHWQWLPAGRLDGGRTRRIRVTFYKTERAFGGHADLDAMAFVPVPG
jgi:hypothetical protein